MTAPLNMLTCALSTNKPTRRGGAVPCALKGFNMNEQQMKEWIDQASYHDLLEHWRFAPSGDPYFQGEMGDYYAKVMREKHDAVGNDAHVRTSKRIGWDKKGR
jgi:hypothetical protein